MEWESQVFFGTTYHKRFSPVHEFSYPLHVFAIDLKKIETLNQSVWGVSYNSFNVFSIWDSEYLTGQGSVASGVQRILDQVLPDTGVSRIVLVSTPKFLGKGFSPVSFYFAYDIDDSWLGVIAEVHNTYHERHFYWVSGEIKNSTLKSFRVEKDFHVSPFFDEVGHYEFKIQDIRDGLAIDITYFKEDEKLLFANLKGEGRKMTSKTVAKTAMKFSGASLLSMPRILWQAGKLYYGKRLPVKGRPVPRSASGLKGVESTWFQRLAMRKLFAALNRIETGQLEVCLPDGTSKRFGSQGDIVRFEIRDYRFFSLLARGGEIGLGEAYMLGYWDTETDLDLVKKLRFLLRNMDVLSAPDKGRFATRLMNTILHYSRHNSLSNSRQNISAHYDLGNDFYDLFLDKHKQYSSGVFETGDEDLNMAQDIKIQRLIQKLDVDSESHVLEIGSGWGGFALGLAAATGCRVTSLTISLAQYKEACERVKLAGLSDRVEIVLQDYREHDGHYDAIVSIEMLEAVGHRYFSSYFRALERFLNPHGRVVLQVITMPDQQYSAYLKRSDWIQKYIFPGGHLPSLEALQQAMKRCSELVVEDLESIGPSYALTLAHWRNRFLNQLEGLRKMGFDEVFIRKWVYYFSYCEAGFAERYISNLQLVLSRPKERVL